MRILGAGLQAEIGAAIALELQGKTYAPIHDCQGHLVCLIDPLNGQAVESYRYSAFGEEIIFNSQGQQVTDSQVGNPWRFASKRLDPETGWIYFGRRYYDPLIGRWTTPDPLSFADGPNLYAYLHHNPLMAYDAYGLFKEGDEVSFEAILQSPEDTFSPESDSEISIQDIFSNGTQAFTNGFLHGMEHPFDVGFENSGVGLIVNFMTQQSDFTQSEPAESPRTLIVQFCDKAGELGGSWFVLSSLASIAKPVVTFGYSQVSRASGWLFAPKEAYELAATRVAIREGAAITAEASTGKIITEEIASVTTKEGVVGCATKAGRNRFVPDANATGAHTVFRKDSLTRKVTHYETYRPQTNPRNPNPWESIKRYDGPQHEHYHFNKITKERVYAPHMHDPYFPGGVRPLYDWEIPY